MTSAQDETIVSFTSIGLIAQKVPHSLINRMLLKGETPYEDSNKPDMEEIELKTHDKQKEPAVESQND